MHYTQAILLHLWPKCQVLDYYFLFDLLFNPVININNTLQYSFYDSKWFAWVTRILSIVDNNIGLTKSLFTPPMEVNKNVVITFFHIHHFFEVIFRYPAIRVLDTMVFTNRYKNKWFLGTSPWFSSKIDIMCNKHDKSISNSSNSNKTINIQLTNWFSQYKWKTKKTWYLRFCCLFSYVVIKQILNLNQIIS